MNDTLVFMNNNKAVTSSRAVPDYFGKRHDDVLKVLDNKRSTTQNYGLLDSMFFESTYTVSKGKANREVIMKQHTEVF